MVECQIALMDERRMVGRTSHEVKRLRALKIWAGTVGGMALSAQYP